LHLQVCPRLKAAHRKLLSGALACTERWAGERQPNAAHHRDGIERDTLGLFVGPEFGDEENTTLPLPPQIILFLENIWDLAEAGEEFFRDEVHTTYLHELGHYLWLDKDDLFDRGLE
jgi:predicted Zn-dependent protease with MMP-like domain